MGDFRHVAVLATALVIGMAAAAQAQDAPVQPAKPVETSKVMEKGGITLVPGRTLSIRWTEGKLPVAVFEGEAPPNPFGPVPTDPVKETWTQRTLQRTRAPDGLLTFTMWRQPDGGTQVALENGTEASVGYIAQMVVPVGDKFTVRPTTICAVKGGGFGVEAWSHPISILVVPGIVRLNDDLCIDAASMRAYKKGEQPPPPKR